MFCTKCGAQIPDHSQFCNACGAPVGTAPTMQQSALYVSPKKKRGAKCVVIIFAAVVVLCAAVLSAVWFGIRSVNSISAKVPDPAAFFGIEAQEDESEQQMIFYTAEDPREAVYEYVRMLRNRFDFELLIGDIDAGDSGFVLEYIGEANGLTKFFENNFAEAKFPWVAINYDGLQTDGSYRFSVELVDGGEFVLTNKTCTIWLTKAGLSVGSDSVDIQQSDTPEQSDTEETETITAVSGPVLPDPAAFLGNPSPIMDEPAEYDGWQLYYELGLDDGWNAGIEYIETLQDLRFNFELRDSFSDTVSYVYSEYYFFDYTGDETIVPAKDQYWLRDYVDYTADVFVRVERNGLYGYSSINIVYSDDLVVQDLGDRASIVPDDAEYDPDNDFSSSDTYKPDFAKLPCLTCDGDGDCTECGGYGTIKRYNGDGEYIDSTCPECHGSRKCRTCNGSGTRE